MAIQKQRYTASPPPLALKRLVCSHICTKTRPLHPKNDSSPKTKPWRLRKTCRRCPGLLNQLTTTASATQTAQMQCSTLTAASAPPFMKSPECAAVQTVGCHTLFLWMCKFILAQQWPGSLPSVRSSCCDSDLMRPPLLVVPHDSSFPCCPAGRTSCTTLSRPWSAQG